MTDLRYAVRSLLRAPGFSVVAVLTLAIGIGANAAIFSVVNGVLLRPLPYPQAERLMEVRTIDPRRGDVRTSTLDFVDLRATSQAFESMAAYTGSGFTLTDGEPEMVLGQFVSPEFFATLRVQPALGRAFRPEESEAGRERVLILGHDLWQRRFGGDARVVGRTTTVNGRAYEVVGVMPAGFTFPHPRYECYAPLYLKGNDQFVNRNLHFLRVVGRLRTSVGMDQARAETQTIAARLAQQHPDTNNNLGFDIVPLHQAVVGDVRAVLLVLLAAVGFVLLIACANVTNLLLARSIARRRELAIRSALGAARWRLVRQLLTEAAVLYAAGGALGLLAATWGMELLLALAPADIPRMHEVTIDGQVLAFTALVSLLTATVFGVMPALQTSRTGPIETLKEGSRGSSGGRQRLRTALVVAEVALSVVLLIAAVLTLRSLTRLMNVDPGFVADRVVTFSLSLPEQRYPDRGALSRFYQRFLQELQGRGIGTAGATTALPLSGQSWNNPVFGERSARAQDPTPPLVGVRGVSPGYFVTMGTRVVSGRDVSWSDQLDGRPVVLVNEALARAFWPGETAVGKRLKFGTMDSPDPWRTIVGIVADVRHEALAKPPEPEMYMPHLQFDDDLMPLVGRGLFVVMRSDADFGSAVAIAKDTARRLDPQLAMREVQPLTALVSASAGEPRFRSVLLGGFAGVAVLLSAIGLYGVLSYLVVQRTREIAIRMALGASRPEITRVVARAAGAPVISGIAIGVTLAFWLVRLIRGMLFEVAPTDPVTFTGVPLILIAVAVIATIVPLRHALRVDPMASLKDAS